MLRDKINKKNDSKQVMSHIKRTTNKIKRKWRTIFNFGWADMFSKANREMEGGFHHRELPFHTLSSWMCLHVHCRLTWRLTLFIRQEAHVLLKRQWRCLHAIVCVAHINNLFFSFNLWEYPSTLKYTWY